MKKFYSLTFCLFINIIAGCSQNDATKPVIGTRFKIELPTEFIEDRSIPGFRSEIDSSIIYIVEIENPYSFEELIQKRISNSISSLGIDTSNFKKSTYDGYRSVEFDTYYSTFNEHGFTVNFGSDEFLVDISITTSINRMEELKSLIMKGKYDKNLEINYDDLLGFTVSYEGTDQKIFKKDANTINTREKDKFGNIISWINLTRMPKSSYKGLNEEEAINATYLYYSFDKSYLSTDSLMIGSYRLLWNTYIYDHVTFQEYNIIGILQKKDFDLLIMGGGNNEEKLGEILNIMRSIKFTNN